MTTLNQQIAEIEQRYPHNSGRCGQVGRETDTKNLSAAGKKELRRLTRIIDSEAEPE